MFATHPEEAALLRAIAANLADDTVRLAYADWLDEQGQVPCERCGGRRRFYKARDETSAERYFLPIAFGPEGEPMLLKPCPECGGVGTVPNPRAEFIRLQCGVAPMPAGCLWPKEVREAALLKANYNRWVNVPCPMCAASGTVRRDIDSRTGVATNCAGCFGSGIAGNLTEMIRFGNHRPEQRHLHPVAFRRGFPFELGGCRLEDVFTWDRVGNAEDLSDRHDEWFPTPWALAVFRAHPTIERVPLAGFDCHDMRNDSDGPVPMFGFYINDMPDPLKDFAARCSCPTEAEARDQFATAVADVLRAAAQT